MVSENEENKKELGVEDVISSKIHQMMMDESDRGCVLVGAAILDQCLEKVLRKKFSSKKHVIKSSVNPLFGVMGPLSSFWSKIQLANSLGMLPRQIYLDLETIRNLRNKFAHEHDRVNFFDQSAITIVEKLNIAKVADKHLKRYSLISEEEDNHLSMEDYMKKEGYVKRTKGMFAFNVVFIYMFLETGE